MVLSSSLYYFDFLNKLYDTEIILFLVSQFIINLRNYLKAKLITNQIRLLSYKYY